jgi:peptidoglycan-associated lipoprotein
MNRLSFVAVLVFAAACHHATPAPTTPVAEAPAAKPPAPAPAPASPSVFVSDDLAKQCTLPLDNVQDAPKFDYDAAGLEPADRDVLEKIATCVTKGPLKGRKLELVGRADPRGTEEYNLGLGSRRAGTVRDFLERLGVTQSQLAQTTRGALDASGTDDSTWKQDRRVDIKLD